MMLSQVGLISITKVGTHVYVWQATVHSTNKTKTRTCGAVQLASESLCSEIYSLCFLHGTYRSAYIFMLCMWLILLFSIQLHTL